jgi:hypothetical protein
MTYYTLNPDGGIACSADTPWTQDGAEILTTDREIVRGYDGRLYLAGEEPVKPPELALQERSAAFTNAIQQRLDDFARTRNYDNIMSAATYATSTVPKFAAEGQYAVAARDATWAKGYEILGAVLAGERPMPTLDEVMAELPALAWPEEAV